MEATERSSTNQRAGVGSPIKDGAILTGTDNRLIRNTCDDDVDNMQLEMSEL
jgi:hypothetical protein